MNSDVAAALITSAVALVTAYFWPWQKAISTALDFARTEYFRDNQVTFRNGRKRRFGTRLSIMIDVCGRRHGVYIMLISRMGTVL